MAPWNNVSQFIFVYMNKGRFKKKGKKTIGKFQEEGMGGSEGQFSNKKKKLISSRILMGKRENWSTQFIKYN